MVAERAQIASADFAIDVIPQFNIDLLTIEAGIFQRAFPTPKRPHCVNPLNQFRVIAFDRRDIQRSTTCMEPSNFADDLPLNCCGHGLRQILRLSWREKSGAVSWLLVSHPRRVAD